MLSIWYSYCFTQLTRVIDNLRTWGLAILILVQKCLLAFSDRYPQNYKQVAFGCHGWAFLGSLRVFSTLLTWYCLQAKWLSCLFPKLKNLGCKLNDIFPGDMQAFSGMFPHLAVSENLVWSLASQSGCPAEMAHTPARFTALGWVFGGCMK